MAQQDGIRLAELAARFGGELIGDPEIRIVQLAPLDRAGPGEIAFLANPRYQSQLAASRAAAVILPPSARDLFAGARIVCDDPYAYYARVAQCLNPVEAAPPGAHPSAVVEAEVPASASIGAGARVAAGAIIGEGVRIGANCSIGEQAQIGEGSLLHAGVIVYGRCVVGRRAVIHSGAVIGADGFGFAHDRSGAWIKIPQIGRVVIGDDVEIGANTTIDRGALDDTVIGDGVKLDNQIQIGHNVTIGEHTAIAGCVGIAGSARIGRRCTFGGAAMILGHLSIADDVHVTAGTMVPKSITKAGTYAGAVPLQSHGDWLKNFAHLRHLEAMADRIRALERRLAELEKRT